VTTVPDADALAAAELAEHTSRSWRSQREHVATHSAFYQQLWDGRRPPSDLRDLPELPLSDKSQLRESQANHPPFGDYLAAPPNVINRMHRTSGTTGQAMNLALSARDATIMAEVGGRCHRAAGLTAAHTVVHCLNYRMWMGGITDHMTLEATGATVVPFGVGGSELLVRTIQEVGITAISCTPSYPAVLEDTVRGHFPGLDPRDLGLKLGLFGGEPGVDDPAFRARMSATWGMQARNANYGVSDVFSNFGAECEFETSLHFMAADVLHAELVDPDSGEPIAVADGRRGELVLTHLARDCQPLVRFRTGDIIEIREAAGRCRCGRTGFRFAVIGRSDDMVIVRGINLFPTMVAAVVNEFSELSGHYVIRLDHPPPYDRLPITVERAVAVGADPVDDEPVDDDPADRELAARVASAIKDRLGASALVTVETAGSLGRTEGKTARVLRTYRPTRGTP